MDIFEIDAKTERALALLDEVAEAIKPMVKEEFVRDDPMRTAYNLIGGSRVSIRNGLRSFRQTVKGG